MPRYKIATGPDNMQQTVTKSQQSEVIRWGDGGEIPLSFFDTDAGVAITILVFMIIALIVWYKFIKK